MKKLLALLAAALTLLAGTALGETLPVYEYTWSEGKTVQSYTSDTLVYTIQRSKYMKNTIYVTKVWMADPGRQICKGMAEWRKSLSNPKTMMKSMTDCVLAINGSGYISPVFPTLEEGYPGESEDYYYTSLGSLAITDGEVLRRMDEVPFYGLSLDADGLHMWIGADNSEVMAGNPTQTWGFWHKCALICNGEDILDRETWEFALARAARTVIAKVDRNNYLLLTVARDESNFGLSLPKVVDFLMENFQLEWAYNLDGGPSSALLYRKAPGKGVKVAYGATNKDFDMLGFIE